MQGDCRSFGRREVTKLVNDITLMNMGSTGGENEGESDGRRRVRQRDNNTASNDKREGAYPKR